MAIAPTKEEAIAMLITAWRPDTHYRAFVSSPIASSAEFRRQQTRFFTELLDTQPEESDLTPFAEYRYGEHS
jgi:hypothetical protein